MGGYIRGVGFIMGCVFWFTSRWAYNRGPGGGKGGLYAAVYDLIMLHIYYVRFSGFFLFFFSLTEFPVIACNLYVNGSRRKS